MANIVKIKDSVWAEFELDTDILEPPVLKLRIKYIDINERVKFIDVDFQKPNEKAIRFLYEKAIELVEDWDLSEDGKKIPCTKENKEKYMRYLVDLNLKDKKDYTLLRAIIEFASDISNYTKKSEPTSLG